MTIAVPALAGAAITPSVAAAIFATPDPIFAAIEEYKRAWLEQGASYEVIDRAHGRATRALFNATGRPESEWREWHTDNDEAIEAAREQAVLPEWAERHRLAEDAYGAAIEGLSETVPTTPAGAAAVLAFLLDDDPEWACEMHESMVRNVVASMERLAAEPAIPATMAPAAATVLIARPDAELLEIGRQLDPIVAEKRHALALDAKEQAEFNRHVLAVLGPNDDSMEYLWERGRLAREWHADGLDIDDDGFNGHRGWGNINGELAELADSALELRATTREGLAVQVLAFVMDYNEVAAEHPEFFGALCDYAGVRQEVRA